MRSACARQIVLVKSNENAKELPSIFDYSEKEVGSAMERFSACFREYRSVLETRFAVRFELEAGGYRIVQAKHEPRGPRLFVGSIENDAHFFEGHQASADHFVQARQDLLDSLSEFDHLDHDRQVL